jgi:hypothetical protein
VTEEAPRELPGGHRRHPRLGPRRLDRRPRRRRLDRPPRGDRRRHVDRTAPVAHRRTPRLGQRPEPSLRSPHRAHATRRPAPLRSAGRCTAPARLSSSGGWITTGGQDVMRRDDLTGWRASLGCWLRLVLITPGLYLLWRLVRFLPRAAVAADGRVDRRRLAGRESALPRRPPTRPPPRPLRCPTWRPFGGYSST